MAKPSPQSVLVKLQESLYRCISILWSFLLRTHNQQPPQAPGPPLQGGDFCGINSPPIWFQMLSHSSKSARESEVSSTSQDTGFIHSSIKSTSQDTAFRVHGSIKSTSQDTAFTVCCSIKSTSQDTAFTVHVHITQAIPSSYLVKNLPAIQETWVQFLDWEDPLEKEMAIHSNILFWRISWIEKPGGQSMRSQRIRHDWVTFPFFFFLSHFPHKSAHICIRVTWMGPLPARPPFGVFTLSKWHLTCHPSTSLRKGLWRALCPRLTKAKLPKVPLVFAKTTYPSWTTRLSLWPTLCELSHTGAPWACPPPQATDCSCFTFCYTTGLATKQGPVVS